MYSSCDDKRTSIGMSLQPTSPAFSYVENLENKSGFMKVVLEDFLKANENPENYAELPEKERLEKFYGVKKSRNEIRQSVQKAVARMKDSEKKRLAYEAEYIRLLRQYGKIFAKGVPFDYFFVHFVVSCTKRLAKDGIPGGDLSYAFFSDIDKFGDVCAANRSHAGWLASLEKQEQSFDEAERMFVLLADHWYSVSAIFPDVEAYSSEQIADSILDYMEAYPDAGYMDNGYAVSSFMRYMSKKLKNTANPAA